MTRLSRPMRLLWQWSNFWVRLRRRRTRKRNRGAPDGPNRGPSVGALLPTGNRATITSAAKCRVEGFVSRSAAQVLEFDQLKEIVAGYTTCVPGRRAIAGLALHHEVAALDAEFVLV